MSYKPYLIAPYKTALELGMPSWMIPKDAFLEMTDCYAYRGVVRKRGGYSLFDRLAASVADENIGTGNGVLEVFTDTLTKIPIKPGSAVVTATNTSDATMTLTDQGNGTLTGDGTGTINYADGSISVDFNAPVKNSTAVLCDYAFYPGLPVMGLQAYVNAGGSQTLMAFDTKRAYAYDDGNAVFDDILGTDTFTGTADNPFWLCNWLNVAYICNGADQLYSYNGTTFAAFNINLGVGPNDVGFAKMIFAHKGHLILLHTQESGNLCPQRMRWCNPGDPNTWSANDYADADTAEFITGAVRIRDDIIVFFERSAWAIKYTGDSRMPFRWQRISGDIGVVPQMSVTSMGDEAFGMGATSITASDGTKVYSLSDKIPNLIYEASPTYLTRAYSGTIEELELVALSYPEAEHTTNNRTVLINHKDYGFSFATLAWTCFGKYAVQDPDIAWDDAEELTWEDMERVWDERSLVAGFPLPIFGDSVGNVWAMQETDGSDNGSAIGMALSTGWFNPFIEEGKKARLGFVDFLVTRDPSVSFKVELALDNDSTPYLTDTLACDGRAGADKVWVRVYSGEVGNFHRVRLSHLGINQRLELHATVLWFQPTGEIHK